ncbi:MAG TPA: HEAT repeat domain-containing protein [Humisphaera sp.]
MDSAKLKDLVGRMPSPADEKETPENPKPGPAGILSNVDKPAVDAALAELEAGGPDAVAGLCGLLVEAKPEADSKARHAIHALVHRAGGAGDAKRQALGAALAEAAAKDGPAEPRAFLLRQVELCAGKDVAPAIGKLLADEKLAAAATSALLNIREGAAEQFRAALPTVKGRARVGVVQALGTLRDAAAAEAIRPLLAEADADTRTAAAWALANIGDAGSVDAMVKLPAGEGAERRALSVALVLLGDRLTAAGRAAEARRVYEHVFLTRTGEHEAHFRAAAETGRAAK